MTKRKVVTDASGRIAARGKKESKPKLTKLSRLEAMLRKPEGATIEQLGKALGWQRHSVRGAVAGSLKRKGIAVVSEQGEGGLRVYRIAG
jgi:hypothetical protein